MTTTSQAAVNTNAIAFGNGTTTATGTTVGNTTTGSGIGAGGAAISAPSTTVIGNNNLNGNSSSNSNLNNLNNAHQSNSNLNSNQRAAEVGKRKKLKSRNATVPNSNSYSKDHLDAWLETCLKDASNTQLSSSSEFLDYNPNFSNNKNLFTTAQQQMSSHLQNQQQQQQQQQHHHLSSQQQQMFTPNAQATNHPHTHQHLPHQHQQHIHQQQQQQQQQPAIQQQQFALRNHHQQSSPSMFSGGYPAQFSLGFQKNMPNLMKHSSSFNNRYSMMYPTTSQFYQQNDGSQDFASLPPIVNILGGSSEHENNSTDVLDGSGSNPNINRGFRFSDPCLLNPSDNDSKISDQNTADQRINHLPSEVENNKFFAALMEQINLLHETNSKICRNLHENKVDIEALKHAPNWGLRHRRDSLSGLSTHSQPMVFGSGFGTHSPAPTYHSGAYTPGMMTDVVREVKEAARVREDALLSRVKAMVEERQWSLNEGSLRMMRDIEELKSQIQHLRADRKEYNKRITHLEAENKYMRQMLASIFNSRTNPTQDIIFENETLRTRKNYHLSRRSNSMNLNYGTIHHQPAPSSYSVEEQEENSALNIAETPSTTSTADVGSSINPQRPAEMRNSFSSSEGGGGNGSGGGDTMPTILNSISLNNGTKNSGVLSPPKFALVSSPADEPFKLKNDKQLPKEEVQGLRRELNEAVEARKEADDRIIALEKLVKNLQVNATNSSYSSRSSTSAAALANGVGQGTGGSSSVIGVGGNNSKIHSIPSTYASSTNMSQMQYTPYQLHHQAHTIASSTSVSLAHSPPKLSVAGPITDL